MVLNNSVYHKPYQSARLMIQFALKGWLPEGEKWISMVQRLVSYKYGRKEHLQYC